MITDEIKGQQAIIRVHDDFYDDSPQQCIERIGCIVTTHYQKKMIDKLQ